MAWRPRDWDSRGLLQRGLRRAGPLRWDASKSMTTLIANYSCKFYAIRLGSGKSMSFRSAWMKTALLRGAFAPRTLSAWGLSPNADWRKPSREGRLPHLAR